MIDERTADAVLAAPLVIVSSHSCTCIGRTSSSGTCAHLGPTLRFQDER